MRNTSRANMRQFALSIVGLVVVLAVLLIPSLVLAEETVESISFVPSRPYFVQGIDGRKVDDSQGSWERYDVRFRKGDELTVRTSDGKVKTYRYAGYEDSFDCVGGGTGIWGPYVSLVAEQSAASPWGLGAHDVTIVYEGSSCVATYELIENPVASISVTLGKPMVFTEFANARETEHYWWEYVWVDGHKEPLYSDASSYYPSYDPALSEGDCLTVAWIDGTSTTYSYKAAEDTEYGYMGNSPRFVNVSDSSDELPMEYLSRLYDDQSFLNQWRVGTHHCNLSFMGKTCQIPVEVKEGRGLFARLWGTNGLATMASIIECGHTRFARGGTVVLATQSSYKDALTAAGLAGLSNGAVLLTSKNWISSITMEELEWLSPSKVYIMGGTLALTEDIENAVRENLPQVREIIRVAGKNAPLTSVQAYEKGTGWSSTCIVATSTSHADALSIAPYAYRYHAPIFLTTPAKLEDAVCKAIKNGGFKRVVIVGGTSAVPTGHEDELKRICRNVVRIGGDNAIQTSKLIAKWCIDQGMSVSHMGVATATSYKDALTGAVLCGSQNSVLVLTRANNFDAIDSIIRSNDGKVKVGYVFGGPAAVPDETLSHCQRVVSGVRP